MEYLEAINENIDIINSNVEELKEELKEEADIDFYN